jgi:hypothetical protein
MSLQRKDELPLKKLSLPQKRKIAKVEKTNGAKVNNLIILIVLL